VGLLNPVDPWFLRREPTRLEQGVIPVPWSVVEAGPRLVSTLETIKRETGFNICFQMGQLVLLRHGKLNRGLAVVDGMRALLPKVGRCTLNQVDP
jgi:hypothetical protein